MARPPAGPPGSTISRPRRWDLRFDESMADADVVRVLGQPPFSRIDPAAFPPGAPLDGILRNDCRLRRYAPGDVVVRRGDYGNSAFYVLSGAVRVLLADGQAPEAIAGHRPRPRLGWAAALRQLLTPPGVPERRALADLRGQGAAAGTARRQGAEGVRFFLQDFPGVVDRHGGPVIGKGEFFGEIAALARSPRTATVVAEQETELLELRWQGLRDIRRRSPEVKDHIDRLYRKNSLQVQLRVTPVFGHLDAEQLAAVAEQTRFESHGEFEWQAAYQRQAREGRADRLDLEPVVAEEGGYPEAVLVVRSGFARLTERHHGGERTLAYLGRGECFGLAEVAEGWRTGRSVGFRRGLRAAGYLDLLVVPAAVMEALVLPGLPEAVLAGAAGAGPGPEVSQGLVEFLAERRLINGRAAMVIDLERCVRCDDCVRACALTHDGNPRFVRSGPQHGRFQIASACMHCSDPVCMIGCPTGAIHRMEDGGQVDIDDPTCIGCGTCAESCPYQNIRMVEVRDPAGRPVLDEDGGLPIRKATKCDLCGTQPSGPACVQACPHDALQRLDLSRLGLAQADRRAGDA